MVIIGFVFFSLLSIYSIWSYRYAKRKEEEGIILATPSKADIIPIILWIVGAIVCFLHAVGLWELLVE